MSYPELERCISVVKALRHPKTGCPWDLEQSHKSLLKYLIEESYEFKEAVELEDPKLMEEEIGDVLLQVLLHSTIASEDQSFDIESVAKTLADKLIRRHPHVFEPGKSGISTDEVIENWKEIKKQEKGEKKYTIDEKCLQAPALESAHKIGVKSKTVNFDWKSYEDVLLKVEEELDELRDELPLGKEEKIREEMGDLLFSVAQLSRHLGFNPEECLRDANKKFINRFKKVEDATFSSGRTLAEFTQAELEEIWKKVKSREA
jgi:MazG family protein